VGIGAQALDTIESRRARLREDARQPDMIAAIPLYLKSALHPDDPGAEAHYDRVYGSVFASCPGFKGIVMVGESVQCPSKDERTTGTSSLTPTEDGLPAG
jgi:hypothetical protein